GGVEQVIFNLAKNLHKMGHNVDITCIGNEDKVIKTKFGKLFVFKVPQFKRFGKFSIFLKKAIYNRKLKKFISKNGSNYDIIHVHGDICGFKELVKFNTILTLHGFSIQAHVKRNLLDRIFISFTSGRTEIKNMKYSKVIIAVSKRVKNFASKFTNKKIKVIYNGIDTKLYRPVSYKVKMNVRNRLGLSNKGVYLLFVGRDDYIKGLDILIEAFTRLKLKNVYLNVVGVSKKLQNETDAVNFVGRTTQTVKYYNASDIFILPSRSEGFSIAGLEALSSGLPTIVSKTSGINEIIKNGVNGLVLERNDPNMIKIYLYKLIKNKKLRKELGKRARKLALEYDWRIVSKAYINIYKSNL
ncbi:MAG: glycosyltransferase family 4 protein, partial [Caldisphaera sp.]